MIAITACPIPPEKPKVLFSSLRVDQPKNDFTRVFRIEIEVETFEDNFECHLSVAALHHERSDSTKKDSVLTIDVPAPLAKNGQ